MNLDPRATIINYESSIMYHDPQFNAQMRQELMAMLPYARHITTADLTNKQ